MSKTTAALEALVANVIENRASDGGKQTARQRANTDKAFASILKLIAPRIRHFVRQYGLVAHWDDAEQVCAIAVHRAIEAYDPEKAQFTTFVNWQIRGELQSLRFRLMTDQRSSAKKVEASTVSINSISFGSEGEENSLESMIEDEDALERTEAAASDFLARSATSALVEEYVDHLRKLGIAQLQKRPRAKRAMANQPTDGAVRFRPPHGVEPELLADLEDKLAQNREIVERRLFEAATLDELGTDTGVTKERVRQITKRAARTMAELAANKERFAVMAEYKQSGSMEAAPRRKAKPVKLPCDKVQATSLLPAQSQRHNELTAIAVKSDFVAVPAKPADSRPIIVNIGLTH